MAGLVPAPEDVQREPRKPVWDHLAELNRLGLLNPEPSELELQPNCPDDGLPRNPSPKEEN